MAASNKVFVSPGVYTTETELSFVAQSVGVTTLGLAGETLKGPAFEPIFVTNYEEFQAYFGTTSPEKFVNTQIPKYELAYIAKAYLQQSNQLFVSRVLGLSGYDAGPSWSITSIANVDSSTIIEGAAAAASATFTFTVNTGTTPYTVTYALGAFAASDPGVEFYTPYVKYDGSTSSYADDLSSFISNLVDDNGLASTTISIWGSLHSSGNTAIGARAVTNNFGTDGDVFSANTMTDPLNDPWYYASFVPTTGGLYSGYSWYATSTITPGATPSGTVTYEIFPYAGTAYTEYDDVVMVTLRSRGISTYSTSAHGPQYQVTANTVTLDFTGSYSATSENPYGSFGISVTDKDSNATTFEVSLDETNANFISKVLGTGNFQKNRVDFPVFVEERFPTLLYHGYNKGYIRGLNSTPLYLEEAQGLDSNSIANYLERYQTAYSPWVVSELRGNTVYQLFRYITISDGNSANREVKVSVANMSFDLMTFDVLVRDYFDTDLNPVVLEKYTSCSMDPSQNNYVAKKIGTADGVYAINSKYIMLEINEEAPSDALPAGFEGYLIRTYNGVNPPFPIYKTKYDAPGDVLYNPPFGTILGVDNEIISSGDNARRNYLGFSTNVGWDVNFFDYKGKQNPSGFTCYEQTYANWNHLTKGFHMDSGATAVTISSIYSTSGTQAFDCGVGQFNTEPTDPNETYYRTYSRKFTVLPYGGFDGWDIYREYRTNGDEFVLGKSGYLAGGRAGCVPYANATGWGAFRQITVEDNTADYANTDYYAYLLGIESFNNPGIININVFATPGIDYVNNFKLVRAAIDMVEIDRADSIYVTTTPDFDLLQPSASMDNFVYPQDAVVDLESTNIDSNYTVTYYPWVLTRDSVYNTQIYIPATAEVCRNLALTDNIAFPWFATAGYTRGIVNSVRARRRLTQLDRDTLYQGRLNPIATFNDVGTVIWGNKTLQLRESPLDRINVRRLLLQARKLISAVAIRLLFEQNDAVVRQQFLDSVNPILDAIRRDRGITDFRVTVSNNPEEFDSNQMSGRIFLKPTKALEFIDIEFIITPQGASFENI
jgi:hypothetical protein